MHAVNLSPNPTSLDQQLPQGSAGLPVSQCTLKEIRLIFTVKALLGAQAHAKAWTQALLRLVADDVDSSDLNSKLLLVDCVQGVVKLEAIQPLRRIRSRIRGRGLSWLQPPRFLQEQTRVVKAAQSLRSRTYVHQICCSKLNKVVNIVSPA